MRKRFTVRAVGRSGPPDRSVSRRTLSMLSGLAGSTSPDPPTSSLRTLECPSSHQKPARSQYKPETKWISHWLCLLTLSFILRVRSSSFLFIVAKDMLKGLCKLLSILDKLSGNFERGGDCRFSRHQRPARERPPLGSPY